MVRSLSKLSRFSLVLDPIWMWGDRGGGEVNRWRLLLRMEYKAIDNLAIERCASLQQMENGKRQEKQWLITWRSLRSPWCSCPSPPQGNWASDSCWVRRCHRAGSRCMCPHPRSRRLVSRGQPSRSSTEAGFAKRSDKLLTEAKVMWQSADYTNTSALFYWTAVNRVPPCVD